jgi:hypothetical protein
LGYTVFNLQMISVPLGLNLSLTVYPSQYLPIRHPMK